MKKLIIIYIILLIGSNISLVKSQSKTGNYKTYYQNGQVKSDENYKNGIKVGICKYYYENGKLQFEEKFNDSGEPDGMFNSYLNNGQLESSYTYRNGERHGLFKEYNENGSLREEGKYEYGRRIHYSQQNIEEQTTLDNNIYKNVNEISQPKGEEMDLEQKLLRNEISHEEYLALKHKSSSSDKNNAKNEIVMPQFKGGKTALMNYIGNNLKYPIYAVEMGIQGKVMVSFIVEIDGSISNVKVSKSLSPECDKEAVRVVSTMPKWIAGKKDGIPARIGLNIPIGFNLQK